jgi:hypothetical protein
VNHRTQTKRGMQWDLTCKLEDLDFADDYILAQHFKYMAEKLVDLTIEARKVGMKINQTKTKAMPINNKNKNTFILDGKEIENVDNIPYPGSVVTKKGDSMEDVRNKISKAIGAFN